MGIVKEGKQKFIGDGIIIFHDALIIMLVMAATVGFMISGCGGGKTSIQVVVTDYSGIPLNGAKVVSLSQPEGQPKLTGITTKVSNKVTFKDIKMGEYQIQISAADYNAQNIKVAVEDEQVFIAKVFLNKLPTTLRSGY
ncbi:MAG: carboxypeptidase regulatory-like domain-containing protein [Dehalococcoidia bacterium]|nr:MAG: carboxypeptidase regulatory-like domain-containing protein [Dehalococcoidia bacterium]